MNRIIAVVLVLVLATPVAAAPRKVLVLPLDGNAPVETRKKLSTSFQKMARVLDGRVEPGNTSLEETATAIGCDPAESACVENVRATLGVDELVYGTANEDAGTITIVARRYQKGKPLRELAVSQAATEPPNKIEPQLLPVFGSEPLAPADLPSPRAPTPEPGTPAPAEPLPQPAEGASNRGRNIAIGVTAGGGLIAVIGFALWAQASGLQDDIDGARTNTTSDFDRLQSLEDKASTRAWMGNLFVVAGLAIAGYGGYRMWTYDKRPSVTVTPVPTDGGAAVTLTIVGDGW